MSRALPPLTWFRAFESAARHLSFTAAAQELGLTQSAISQQVHALEARLGCLLFRRKNRGLALTDEGRRLVPSVSQALGTLRQATNSFDIGDHRATLTIAASVSIAQWYLVPRIKAFRDAHEGAAVRMMTKVWPDEFSGLRTDVEIRFDSLATVRPNTSILGRNEILTVAAPDLVHGVNVADMSVDDIGAYPLIQVLGTADTWQVWASQNGAKLDVQPSIFVESHGMAVDLARSGAGISLTSSTIAAPSIANGGLTEIGASRSTASDGYHLSVNAGTTSELAVEFADWITAEIAAAEDTAYR